MWMKSAGNSTYKKLAVSRRVGIKLAGMQVTLCVRRGGFCGGRKAVHHGY